MSIIRAVWTILLLSQLVSQSTTNAWVVCVVSSQGVALTFWSCPSISYVDIVLVGIISLSMLGHWDMIRLIHCVLIILLNGWLKFIGLVLSRCSICFRWFSDMSILISNRRWWLRVTMVLFISWNTIRMHALLVKSLIWSDTLTSYIVLIVLLLLMMYVICLHIFKDEIISVKWHSTVLSW